MSVIDVTQMWSKQGGSVKSNRFSAYDLTYDLTAGYSVLCEVGDNEATILSHPDVPKHGQQHPSGLPAYVTSVEPQAVSPILWHVSVGYEGSAAELDMPDENVEVEWSDVTTTERIDRDYNGDAIVTVNGEPVEGLSMDVADQVVVIRRRFNSINTYSIAAYRRSTNSDTFLGWPPGTARLVGFSAKNQFKQGALNERWDVTARIQFREPYANTTAAEAWYLRWRHEGFYIDDGSGNIIRAPDDNNEPSVKPVLLKTDGTKETDPAAAVFYHTQVYGSLPYASLGLL